jgi:proline dehydrogenase
VAFPHKTEVDENYFSLASQLLGEPARRAGVRAGLATHDLKLIRRIIDYADAQGLSRSAFEFQMLYGIQREEQYRLAHEGWKSVVLIAYGSYWFPWYMRRLAERPANAWFVLRNLFAT